MDRRQAVHDHLVYIFSCQRPGRISFSEVRLVVSSVELLFFILTYIVYPKGSPTLRNCFFTVSLCFFASRRVQDPTLRRIKLWVGNSCGELFRLRRYAH
jgi:hypothetical protein